MESVARKIARHTRIRSSLLLGRNASTARRFWLVKPDLETGERLCIFVTHLPDGELSDRVRRHIDAWVDAGFRVIVAAALDDLDTRSTFSVPSNVSGLLLRENVGYDFGAWASVIAEMPRLRDCDALAIANDSVLGPIGDFRTLVESALASEADIVGLTESTQRRVHLQSYFILFKRTAICSPAFWSFWSSVKNGNRDFVVSRYETLMSDYFRRHGMTTRAMFPTPGCTGNPTLDCWRELRDRGFPYLKAALLRDGAIDFDPVEARPYLSGDAL